MAKNRSIEIIGSDGKINSDLFGPSLYFYNRNSLSSKLRGQIQITPGKFDPKIPDEALKWSYKSETNQFLNAIIDNKTPSVTGEEAFNNLKIILSTYKSINIKSTIK
jgi:predicted dehydrogenase